MKIHVSRANSPHTNIKFLHRMYHPLLFIIPYPTIIKSDDFVRPLLLFHTLLLFGILEYIFLIILYLKDT